MAIKEAYEYMDEASKADNLSGEKFLAGLRTICETDNISLFVMDQNGRARLTSVHDSEELQRDLYEYVLGIRPNQKSILAENDQYLMSVNRDSPNGGYLKMAGVLSGGEPFIIRTAVEPIRESVSLANRFLIYVGSIVLLVGAFIIHWVSKRISEPILELARLSERMSDLDFDVKFEGGRDSEIIFLGNHMNQLSETLEKTISELKTANNELQRDIEQKEKRDEMRKEFLSNVSHELKTPIALVQGYAEGLLENVTTDDESRKFYAEVILDESNKMDKLVKQLLELMKIEYGKREFTNERFDLKELIDEVIRKCNVMLKENGITINFRQEEPVYIYADEFYIDQAVTNYFTNAIKHAEEKNGKKEIEIRLEKLKDKNKVRLYVYNTGENIEQEDLERIWKRFYKVDTSRNRENGGTGIGLALVKAIMNNYKNEYGVANKEDGVEFYFDLDLG